MATRRKRWSQQVTEHSDALTLDSGVFARPDPRSIARSLKRSAERSRRRKSSPYRSAMSMLTFYVNRAGSTLSPTRRRKLERAKEELRRLYGKQDGKQRRDGQTRTSAARKRSTRSTKSRSTAARRTH